mgnify:CR=1 FL=1
MKFVANLLVAIHNVAAAEALVLAMKAGSTRRPPLEVISAGAGAPAMFQVRGPMMVRGDYSRALMKLGVWQKDMTVIADFAREVGAPTPLSRRDRPDLHCCHRGGRWAGHRRRVRGPRKDGRNGRRRKFAIGVRSRKVKSETWKWKVQ